jgi:hypothetical protein
MGSPFLIMEIPTPETRNGGAQGSPWSLFAQRQRRCLAGRSRGRRHSREGDAFDLSQGVGLGLTVGPEKLDLTRIRSEKGALDGGAGT